MRHLPDRPNLDQLRHQARELHRAAAAGDPDATRRLQVVSLKTTLSAAQLALAREHGFSSWTRLKAEVERRRAFDPASYVIRPVNSQEELIRVFDFVGANATPRITHADRRLQELVHRFPEDRSLMLVVENRHRLVGGLLACRRGSTAAVRAIGLAPGLPVEGLTTRLLQRVETEAVRLGASEIHEGGVGDLKDLYERQGYFGRNPMTKQLLPLPGRAREALEASITNGGQTVSLRPAASPIAGVRRAQSDGTAGALRSAQARGQILRREVVRPWMGEIRPVTE